MNTNEMTELEMHLRSWVPRPPSKTLRPRLFPRPRPTAPHAQRPGPQAVAFHLLAPRFTLSWLTASAAALLLLAFLHHPHSALSPGKDSPAIIAMALSNRATTTTLYAASSNEQFSAPTPSLALTNLRPLTSSFSPPSLTLRTN